MEQKTTILILAVLLFTFLAPSRGEASSSKSQNNKALAKLRQLVRDIAVREEKVEELIEDYQSKKFGATLALPVATGIGIFSLLAFRAYKDKPSQKMCVAELAAIAGVGIFMSAAVATIAWVPGKQLANRFVSPPMKQLQKLREEIQDFESQLRRTKYNLLESGMTWDELDALIDRISGKRPWRMGVE